MDKELPVIEHLQELRRRIIFCLVSLGIFSIIGLGIGSYLLEFLKFPARNLISKLVFFSPQEGFLIYMRLGILFGFVCSLPIILYQIWAFISPALEEKFRKYTLRFVFFSFFSFLMGIGFSYFVILPSALGFLLGFAKDQLQPLISAEKYISFVSSLLFLTGLLFLFPVISIILARFGILNHRFLRKNFKFAIVLILVICAVITPTTDAFNLLILAVPSLLLYEISIWLCWFFEKKPLR